MAIPSIGQRIRYFACDIDGCLAAAGHAAYDLESLGRMAELNRLSRIDDTVPALTLVTGRPHAYVDALTQLLDIDATVSFENGAGLATRLPYRAWLTGRAAAGARSMAEFAALLEADGRFLLQPGKLASLSVFPHPMAGETTALTEVEAALALLIEDFGQPLALDPSTDCVNVLLEGVDKASGFLELCAELGVTPGEVAGIGDSVGDLGWLAACGVSVAPANALPEVRAAADVTLPGRDAEAALAAYNALVEANRRL